MSRLVETLKISREGIREIYAQGEESVINLVERLIEELNKQEIRLEALERQQKKNSRNSSKPPSSDGLKRLPKSLRTKSEKKSGGQIGHEGSNLEWSTAIDYVETHKVSECGGCGSQFTVPIFHTMVRPSYESEHTESLFFKVGKNFRNLFLA